MLILPLALAITLGQWLLFGLIIQLELYVGFELFKPLLAKDEVGWTFLLLALAVVVIDVFLYLRIPDEVLDSRKLARKLLKVPG